MRQIGVVQKGAEQCGAEQCGAEQCGAVQSRGVQETPPACAVPQLAGVPEEEQDAPAPARTDLQSPAGAREDLQYPAQRGGPRTFADFPADGGGARPPPHSEGGAPSTGAEVAQVTVQDAYVRTQQIMTKVAFNPSAGAWGKYEL